MTQHAQHAQAVQTLQAEASSLASSKQSLETELARLRIESRQLQGQVQALQGSMLEQAQHAQQATAQLRSERESDMLSMRAAHAAQVAALKGKQAASAQEAEDAIQAQQQQADHLQATLLARFTALERRFNARYAGSRRKFMTSLHPITLVRHVCTVTVPCKAFGHQSNLRTASGHCFGPATYAPIAARFQAPLHAVATLVCGSILPCFI